MKIATAGEMRRIDKTVVEEFGIPELILMENAGRAAAEVVVSLVGNLNGKAVCVLAGGGNNGGDAFCAARYIANHGAKVRVFLLGTAAHMGQSAAANRDICLKMGIDVFSLAEVRDWDRLEVILRFSDVVLDGILGTGFKGELRDDARKLIKTINNAGKPVVSIDLPSGVNSDTGGIGGDAVRADMTVTLGVPKAGHFFCPGAACTGRLVVDPIGIPASLLNDEALQTEYLDDDLARSMLVPRAMDVHKGDCGRILIVAGSTGMTGAAAMAAGAALRVGAGIVTVAVPESLNDIMEIKLTEAMTLPLPEKEPGRGVLDPAAFDTLIGVAGDYDAVLVGPGLGRNPETGEVIRRFCAEVDRPLILDADALFAYIGHTDELVSLKTVPVITPHLGEMAALCGGTVAGLRQDIIAAVRKAAAEWNTVIVLKSECTAVACPEGTVWLTSKGNPNMATAGAGDVLAGTIAGLTKQLEPGASPLLGVYLHGLAGDLAAKSGGAGIIASDICNNLPKARLCLESGKLSE